MSNATMNYPITDAIAHVFANDVRLLISHIYTFKNKVIDGQIADMFKQIVDKVVKIIDRSSSWESLMRISQIYNDVNGDLDEEIGKIVHETDDPGTLIEIIRRVPVVDRFTQIRPITEIKAAPAMAYVFEEASVKLMQIIDAKQKTVLEQYPHAVYFLLRAAVLLPDNTYFEKIKVFLEGLPEEYVMNNAMSAVGFIGEFKDVNVIWPWMDEKFFDLHMNIWSENRKCHILPPFIEILGRIREVSKMPNASAPELIKWAREENGIDLTRSGLIERRQIERIFSILCDDTPVRVPLQGLKKSMISQWEFHLMDTIKTIASQQRGTFKDIANIGDRLHWLGKISKDISLHAEDLVFFVGDTISLYDVNMNEQLQQICIMALKLLIKVNAIYLEPYMCVIENISKSYVSNDSISVLLKQLLKMGNKSVHRALASRETRPLKI